MASDYPNAEVTPAVVGLLKSFAVGAFRSACDYTPYILERPFPSEDGRADGKFLLIFLVLYCLILSLAGIIPLCSVL